MTHADPYDPIRWLTILLCFWCPPLMWLLLWGHSRPPAWWGRDCERGKPYVMGGRYTW